MLEQQSVNQTTSMLRGSRPAAPLDFLWLEVTAKCNLRCVHCYSDSTPQRPLHDSMTADDWNDMLEQAALLGCRAVQFIGGEPTMYPALGRLIERARALEFRTVEVFTNGTMFKPKLKEIFLRHKVDLAFSVYAPSAQIHDMVTKQAGSFDRTIASIRWAIASGLSVRAAIIEMEANAGQSGPTRELLEAMGVKRIGADHLRGVGRGAKDQSKSPHYDELCGACWRGKLAVTASGQIFPCVFSRAWPVGHANQGLRAVVEDLPLHAFRQAMQAYQRSPRLRSGMTSDLHETISSCAPDPGCIPNLCNPENPDIPCAPDGLQPPCAPTGAICGPDPCTPTDGCQPLCSPFAGPCTPSPNVG
jgi:uncharacterized Fe-S cluster-containing radical SAM superfamily protein